MGYYGMNWLKMGLYGKLSLFHGTNQAENLPESYFAVDNPVDSYFIHGFSLTHPLIII
jgi:hydrogenase/urease accessory protein HupE